MRCWICGGKGMTGEHLIKNSDLKSQFGSVTQADPIYLRKGNEKSRKIQSTNSKLIKSNTICGYCNSTKTQPFDKAWEKMSAYLQENNHPVLSSGNIDLRNVYGRSYKKSMLLVHLYFIKLFGCKIKETNFPIKLSSFRRAINKRKPHKNVFISFNYLSVDTEIKNAGHSTINKLSIGGGAESASWVYIIGKIGVNVYYWRSDRWGALDDHSWHPSSIESTIPIKIREARSEAT